MYRTDLSIYALQVPFTGSLNKQEYLLARHNLFLGMHKAKTLQSYKSLFVPFLDNIARTCTRYSGHGSSLGIYLPSQRNIVLNKQY